MKKILSLFLLLILVVGCKNRKYDELICKYQNTNNEDIEGQISDTITFKLSNDEAINYDKTTVVVFENYEEASNYYKNLDDDYDTVEVVDNKVTMNIRENIDGMTKKELKSMYEQYGFECK